MREQRLVAHLAQPENEAPLTPVLNHWYESEGCKAIMPYAAQYKERAARFLFKRPARYTQAAVVGLCEQYSHHAGLVQQQLRSLSSFRSMNCSTRPCGRP